LALALTDTFGRTAIETFSEMASRYHVWLEAGVNMTQAWHVVCRTDEHPPQEPCTEQNPAKVEMLGDPQDPDRGYAYEAVSPRVSNMALVFGPDGKLVSKQVKNYTTPSEVGQDEGVVAALDLVPGAIWGDLGPVSTPVGTLGFVTSKDAWMPDVVDKLEEGTSTC
jgi:predicted amidohydrolase